jgi:hypothetical protein
LGFLDFLGPALEHPFPPVFELVLRKPFPGNQLAQITRSKNGINPQN